MENTGASGASEAPGDQQPHFDLSIFRACMDKSKKGTGFCLLPGSPPVLPGHFPQWCPELCCDLSSHSPFLTLSCPGEESRYDTKAPVWNCDPGMTTVTT